MKYIPADKLIAEIDSRMEDCKLPDGRFPTTTNIVRYEELSCLRNFITSLQQEQPGADLEKEIDRVFFKGDCRSQRLTHKEIAQIARHFYERGQIDAANKFDEIEYNRLRDEAQENNERKEE